MINLDRIRKKAADVRGALALLRTLASHTESDLLADDVLLSAAKYQLLVATEAAMDICGHISVKSLGKAPEGYADCFRILAGAGAIGPDLSQRLTAMARFRNLLVYQYGDIDNSRVYRILHENLGDLEQYLVEVGQYVGDPI